MRGYMFRNRLGALFFVGATLVGVAQLVGTGKGDGAIEQARQQIAARPANAPDFAIGGGQGVQTQARLEFTPDDELIDLAAGEDPTPVDQRSEETEDPSRGTEEVPPDTVIVLADQAGTREEAQ